MFIAFMFYYIAYTQIGDEDLDSTLLLLSNIF